MDTSRRAVESYWRSRMIDGVTADEDKVAPVYKLEEICELLRTSHASIVKEVSEFILKRLDHKSPIVKQKALRLIRYAVGKSGAEFRREMQRNSAAVRQLLHYKGELDSLKGDALNKAVRDMAQEAISALFSSDDNKTAVQVESINKRIEGFGNTNYEMRAADKKSFLSEVVGLGTASIIHGLTSLAASRSLKTNDNGTYRSPNLRRSLTNEADGEDRYESVNEHHGDGWQSSGSSRNVGSASWNTQARNSLTSSASVGEENNSSHVVVKSREERLLETIVTAGGVRLQPTREALQAFLIEASKMDALVMSRAIETKLQSPVWQVRMKAICVLESILRKNGDDDYCSIIASYFSENIDPIIKCCELPQSSLREKSSKVLSLLGGVDQLSETGNESEPTDGKPHPVPAVQLPYLIDTGDTRADDDDGEEASSQNIIPDLSNDLFGVAPVGNKNEDDPFADVSFHVSDDKHNDDIFSQLAVDDHKPDQMSSSAQSNDHLMARFSLSGPSNVYYPMASIMQPNLMLSTQPVNYGAFIAQQHLMFQNSGIAASPAPDIFRLSDNPAQNHGTVLTSTKKEDTTKAFDFISEHMAAARDSKRIR